MAYLQADPDLSAVLLDSTVEPCVLAQDLEARAVVAEISYKIVRRTLKKTN